RRWPAPTRRCPAPAEARAPARGRRACAPARSRLELLSQARERAGGPRLDRSLAHREHLRRLSLRELEEVPAGDDVAVALVETVDPLEQVAEAFPLERGRLGRRGRVSLRLSRGAERELRTSPGGTSSVVLLVGDDPQEPGLERRARAEPRQRRPRLHE